VALPASAAERRAAARLLLATGRAAIDRYLQVAGPTAANLLQRRAAVGWDRQTDRQRDGRMNARQMHGPVDRGRHATDTCRHAVPAKSVNQLTFPLRVFAR